MTRGSASGSACPPPACSSCPTRASSFAQATPSWHGRGLQQDEALRRPPWWAKDVGDGFRGLVGSGQALRREQTQPSAGRCRSSSSPRSRGWRCRRRSGARAAPRPSAEDAGILVGDVTADWHDAASRFVGVALRLDVVEQAASSAALHGFRGVRRRAAGLRPGHGNDASKPRSVSASSARSRTPKTSGSRRAAVPEGSSTCHRPATVRGRVRTATTPSECTVSRLDNGRRIRSSAATLQAWWR